MKNVNLFKALFLFFALTFPTMGASTADYSNKPLLGHILIVSNTSSGVTNLSNQQLREIFLLKNSYWNNGEKIKVFVLQKDNLITRLLFSSILRINISSYYDNVVPSSGRIEIVDSEFTMFLKLLNTRGSIGYLSTSTYFTDNELKIINISN